KVIISSTSPHWVLQRKLDAFEKRGGAQARKLTEDFWTHPDRDTFQAYWDGARELYNTRPPADPDAGERATFNLDILLHFAGGEIRTMQLAPGLKRAQCPVLVMTGEEDPICPPGDADDIVAALPPHLVQFAKFPRVGHGAWRDDADAAFAVLRRFITQ
ncbi:MAG TPA: alpha/beta hydrolase, partial [Ramlibacter sp.]